MVRVAVVSSELVKLSPIRGGAVEEYVYQFMRHLRRLGVAVAVDSMHNDKPKLEDVGTQEYTIKMVRTC